MKKSEVQAIVGDVLMLLPDAQAAWLLPRTLLSPCRRELPFMQIFLNSCLQSRSSIELNAGLKQEALREG
jgi:hypothetical protein